MAASPLSPNVNSVARARILTRARLISVIALSVLLVLSLVFVWITRDAMQHLPSMSKKRWHTAGKSLVDQSLWQTIESLTPLAVSAEETTYAREAARLADHAVDQAFAAALREATLRAQHRTLTGAALVLSQKVAQLQQRVQQDQDEVKQLAAAQPAANTPAPGNPQGDASSGTDLDIAKAQLGLDSDELADANADLDRASGDERSEIQNELTARNAAMKKYDEESRASGEPAVIGAARFGTLAGRIGAWFRQQTRLGLIQQAQAQAQASAASMTAAHNALEAQADKNSSSAGQNEDRAAHLSRLRDESVQRQLLSIYDDSSRTAQRLANVYQRWSDQVQQQHSILQHLILQSVAWILFILLCGVIVDSLLNRLMEHPRIDARQKHMLQAILRMVVQLVGAASILMVIFGAPQQTTELLGLTTAAVTIALQDFVLAFFGWFVLIGPKGLRVGDTVEIEGVGGEVVEIGLMATTLLETSTLEGKGYPTGRRTSFMNSFAIRGHYFNFSTAGQWMWDQFEIAVPASGNTPQVAEKIQQAVTEETAQNARLAEQEWKRSARGGRLSSTQADAAVDLTPSANAFSLEVRYVTRASERAETRNRIYKRVIAVLNEPAPSA